jgi:hypothetical protein
MASIKDLVGYSIWSMQTGGVVTLSRLTKAVVVVMSECILSGNDTSRNLDDKSILHGVSQFQITQFSLLIPAGSCWIVDRVHCYTHQLETTTKLLPPLLLAVE